MEYPGPEIIVFLCNWCSYECADGAGRAGLTHFHGTRVIRVMCTGRIDPQFVLHAFKQGADGVLILGCRLGECHYREGNFQALKRFALLKKLLPQLGINSKRLEYHWISASDYREFVEVVRQMHEVVSHLGPLYPSNPRSAS